MIPICVIGAGPAGLMAAIEAQKSAPATILERNESAGRKLLLTGGGRCNLTHAGTIQDFVKACHPYGNSLKPAFYTLSPADLIAFFQTRRLDMVIEPNGCVFPRHGKASDVLAILLQEAAHCGVRIVTNSRVRQLEKNKEVFVVHTDNQSFSCRAVVLAVGGAAWPQTGSSGDAFKWAEQFGHTIVEPIGILCPIVCEESWPGSLQGTSLESAAITVRTGTKPITCTGAAVFTEDGIGGPAAFDVTRITAPFVRRRQTVSANFDFCPDRSKSQMEMELLRLCAEHPKKEIISILNSYAPKRVCELLLRTAVVRSSVSGGQLRKEERRRLIDLFKEMPLTVIRHGAIEKATVTGGGVLAREIDSRTMQSRLCPGLFFAGEMMDVDGPCGGYNLQIAFSTGALAGRCAAAYVNVTSPSA